MYIQICTNKQDRKFAQVCSLNSILHKYEARMEMCKYRHPGEKFAQIFSQNENLHKYAALLKHIHKYAKYAKNGY